MSDSGSASPHRSAGRRSRHRLGDLAALVGGEVRGDSERSIVAVRSLEHAGPEDLSFFVDPRYRQKALDSSAGALVVGPGGQELGLEADLIVSSDALRAVAKIVERVHPTLRREPGIHPTAVVGDGCSVPASAFVGAYSVIGDGTVLGENVVVEPLVAIGRGCSIGEGTVLYSHSVLYDSVEIGDGSVIHAGAVLGADGFGVAGHGEGQVKMPQIGRVVLGDQVEVGANSTIDRATLDETRIGRGTKIDNLVQVGHNVELGEGCILCAQSGISGSTVVGDHVLFAGQTGAAGHLEIGSGVQVAAKASVLRSVESGAVGGTPAIPLGDWKRQVVAAGKLPELRKRVARLERRLAELERSGEIKET